MQEDVANLVKLCAHAVTADLCLFVLVQLPLNKKRKKSRSSAGSRGASKLPRRASGSVRCVSSTPQGANDGAVRWPSPPRLTAPRGFAHKNS